MITPSLPVLLQDGSRFDWLRARYEPQVRLGPTRATVNHVLRDASTLESLVRENRARWATELRCPKTLFATVQVSTGSPMTRQTVKWERERVDGELFLIPGLLALEDFRLKPRSNELTPVWRDVRLQVKAGWWLVRGLTFRTRTLGQSLLRFVPDRKLPSGRMSVEPDDGDDDLRFHVRLAKDIWPERKRRHLQVAALIGAMGRMVGRFDDPDEDPPVVREIRRRLRDSQVPDWTDLERYDPARAATSIEEFHPTDEATPNAP